MKLHSLRKMLGDICLLDDNCSLIDKGFHLDSARREKEPRESDRLHLGEREKEAF